MLQKDLPEAGHFIRKRGRDRERTREIVLALVTWLSTVSALAALELSCVTRAEVPIALALELAVAVRPVCASRRVPLLWLGSIALGLGPGAVDAREKECNLGDLHGECTMGKSKSIRLATIIRRWCGNEAGMSVLLNEIMRQ